MPDTKISALTAIASIAGEDLLAVVDDPAGTPATTKATVTQIRAYLIGLATTWTATQTITPAANTEALVSTGYSLTGSNAQSLIDLAGTWNTTGTPTAIKLNITNTASNTASKFLDFQVGGVSKISFSSTDFGTCDFGNRTISATGGSVLSYALYATETIQVASNADICWTNGAYNATKDTRLYRDAAAVLALRNSTNAQTFRVYNTYTDASNYERGFIKWASNTLEIGAEAAGTGTSRTLKFFTGGSERLTITSSGTTTVVGDFTSTGFIAWYRGSTVGWTTASNGLAFGSGATLQWTSGNPTGTVDTILERNGAGILALRGTSTSVGGALNLLEQTAPSAPSANQVVIYAQDNGAGKTQLMALFGSGAAQQIAIEP